MLGIVVLDHDEPSADLHMTPLGAPAKNAPEYMSENTLLTDMADVRFVHVDRSVDVFICPSEVAAAYVPPPYANPSGFTVTPLEYAEVEDHDRPSVDFDAPLYDPPWRNHPFAKNTCVSYDESADRDVHVMPSVDVAALLAPVITNSPAPYAMPLMSVEPNPDVRVVQLMQSGDVASRPFCPTTTNSPAP